MSKNPLMNALGAIAYIALVASGMFYGKGIFDETETVFIPIAMLSLFVLSAAMMGYFFLLAPLRLYFDGEKEAGARLFTRTVGVFAVITIIFFIINYLV